ncbi:MAG: bactofilin family protein [Hyphomicrobiaceae bacterium]
MFARDADNPSKRERGGEPAVALKPGAGPLPDAAASRGGLASAAGSAPRVESVTRTTISADLTIEGNVVSKGEVQVDGDIKGSIRCAALVIGENSEILGDIIAEEIVVRGRVIGSVHGSRVQLQSTAYVEGDIHHQALGIEQGASFEGKSKRVEDPVGKAVAARAAQQS